MKLEAYAPNPKPETFQPQTPRPMRGPRRLVATLPQKWPPPPWNVADSCELNFITPLDTRPVLDACNGHFGLVPATEKCVPNPKRRQSQKLPIPKVTNPEK